MPFIKRPIQREVLLGIAAAVSISAQAFPAVAAAREQSPSSPSAESTPPAPRAEVLQLGQLPPPAEIAELLWQHAPELQAARARLESGRAAVERSRLLPNPAADFAVGGMAVGQTNPPGLDRSQTPSYSVQLSELIEIGKRGPRQDRARADLQATALAVYDELRQRWFDLNERIAEVAAAELRVAAMASLAEDTAELAQLEHARVQKGAAAGLDAERATLEEDKYRAALVQEQSRLQGELLACGRIAGVPCLAFGDADAARRYLSVATTVPLPRLEERPDLAALQAQADAAGAQRRLAERRKIPDPSLRAGYTHDQLTVAGNQPNTLFFGVSIPLPVFDRGQADVREASALQVAARAQRELLLAQAARDLARLGELESRLTAEEQRLSSNTIPGAHRLVDRLDELVRRGGASLYDLLLARRTLGELVVNGIEVETELHRVRLARSRVAGAAPPAPFSLERR